MKRSLKGSKTGGTQKPPMDYEEAVRMAQNMDQSTMNTIQDTVNKYGGKSPNELMRELRNCKQAGIMDNRELDNVAKRLMPMLTEEQQRRLFDVMGELKK
ncbi:MAG TPA: hypothetical protein VN512_11265 [Clostridia bacterium]|nr:hypothetical protein [Clostridia bacterium]